MDPKLNERIVHLFGLFKFRTGNTSLPSTPTATTRSRAAIFGLDAISRNLFNARPGSAMGDLFGGSAVPHKRSKSATSRSSGYTQTNSTGDDSLTKFSRRSNSTATAATTVDDDSLGAHRTPPRPRKLLKRGKSPEFDKSSPIRRSARSESASTSRSRSQSSERELDSRDGEKAHGSALNSAEMDQSEWDLTMRLELARRNSNQHGKQVAGAVYEKPKEEVIYEGIRVVYL